MVNTDDRMGRLNVFNTPGGRKRGAEMRQIVAAGVLGFLVLAGCGNDSSTTARTPTTQPQTTTVKPPADTPSLEARLQTAGIDCHGQALVGNVQCTFNGERAKVSVGGWAETEPERRQACEQGYVNTGYVVATDRDHLAISANQNATTQAIAKALGIEVVTYCP